MLTQRLPAPMCFSVAQYYKLSELGIIASDRRTELIEGEVIESVKCSTVPSLKFKVEELLPRKAKKNKA